MTTRTEQRKEMTDYEKYTETDPKICPAPSAEHISIFSAQYRFPDLLYSRTLHKRRTMDDCAGGGGVGVRYVCGDAGRTGKRKYLGGLYRQQYIKGSVALGQPAGYGASCVYGFGSFITHQRIYQRLSYIYRNGRRRADDPRVSAEELCIRAGITR